MREEKSSGVFVGLCFSRCVCNETYSPTGTIAEGEAEAGAKGKATC
jgi:hypothetical protein